MVPSRHGPKPDSHEAEAFTKLEAETLTFINLEAEALVTKPKPGYLYYTHLKRKTGCKGEALVNHKAEAFENQEARLPKI